MESVCRCNTYSVSGKMIKSDHIPRLDSDLYGDIIIKSHLCYTHNLRRRLFITMCITE